MAAVECADHDFESVDSDLRRAVGVTSMEVRRIVIVEVHRDQDSEEATDRRHVPDRADAVGRILSAPRRARPARRRSAGLRHFTVAGTPQGLRRCTHLHRWCTRVRVYAGGVVPASRDCDLMGRRARRRAAGTAASGSATHTRDHQARVSVSDETWRKFRDVVGNDSIASFLGRLVEREVERERARRVRDGTVDDLELLNALVCARELHDHLSVIVARLERRLDGRQH
jgi:hypothetical protein